MKRRTPGGREGFAPAPTEWSSNRDRAQQHAAIAEGLLDSLSDVDLRGGKGPLAVTHATLALFYRDLPDQVTS